MIPSKPLVVSPIDYEELTLGELAILQGEEFSATRFCEFLARYTNWTVDEIKNLTVKELRTVAKELGEKLKEQATPKA